MFTFKSTAVLVLYNCFNFGVYCVSVVLNLRSSAIVFFVWFSCHAVDVTFNFDLLTRIIKL